MNEKNEVFEKDKVFGFVQLNQHFLKKLFTQGEITDTGAFLQRGGGKTFQISCQIGGSFVPAAQGSLGLRVGGEMGFAL